MIEADFAIMHKTRPAHDAVEVTEITGRVRGKIAIVGDDVIMTGGTLLANVAALKEHGATEVWVFATHGLFSTATRSSASRTSTSRGSSSPTPCRSTRCTRPTNLTVLTVSGLLAETIMNVFADDSVSAIFGGENQLF